LNNPVRTEMDIMSRVGESSHGKQVSTQTRDMKSVDRRKHNSFLFVKTKDRNTKSTHLVDIDHCHVGQDHLFVYAGEVGKEVTVGRHVVGRPRIQNNTVLVHHNRQIQLGTTRRGGHTQIRGCSFLWCDVLDVNIVCRCLLTGPGFVGVGRSRRVVCLAGRPRVVGTTTAKTLIHELFSVCLRGCWAISNLVGTTTSKTCDPRVVLVGGSCRRLRSRVPCIVVASLIGQ
jgi:hypothetical protein